MMEYINVVRKGERTHTATKSAVDHADRAVPPPHRRGAVGADAGTGSVFDSSWPSFDPALAKEDTTSWSFR